MLYAILKPIVSLALRLYFRRISHHGLEQIDNGKPTLILANHTASFMDAILVACLVKRRIHFFARGDVFGKPLADKILRSIGLLPVYRLSEGRDKLQLNDSSNDEALKILAKGGAVLIFCEGVSDVAKRLKPLKKGPFRLAANAAGSLGNTPLIVPLGINYVTPARPGGDVFLEGGAGIDTSSFIATNSGTSLAKAATEMMRRLQAELEPLVFHTVREGDGMIADEMLLALQHSGREYSFEAAKRKLSRLNKADDAERAHLRKVLQSQHPVRRKHRVWQSVLLIPTSPIALVGWAFHVPVIVLAKTITDKKVQADDFLAPVFLSIAMLLTIAWYGIWLLGFEVILPSLLWPCALLGTAGCGIFYLKVWRHWLS